MADWYIVCLVRITITVEAVINEENIEFTLANSRQTNFPTVLASTNNVNVNMNDSLEMADSEFYDRIIFHRLDLTISPKRPKQMEIPIKLCQYFQQISTADQPILYLSPRSFKSPYQHLKTMCENGYASEKHDKCFHRIESIMAYIKDTTNLLTNPGLQQDVRSMVLQLSQFIEMLRVQHTSTGSRIGKYVIRRYITSMNGIMFMYPGTVLPNDFEPNRRPWFRKAIENPDKLSLTAPYLDFSGAGYVITISHAIYETISHSYNDREKKRRRRQQNFDRKQRNIAAIVSIDVTPGFLYQVLLQSSDHCRSDGNIKCFLIDDMGYLVVHPNILEPKLQSNVVQFNAEEHITHRESLIANDILLHKNLVEKRLCQNLLNRKIQRYYKLNTSLTEVLTNVVNGERSKYQITSISNTNLFVVVLNSTDPFGTAFCPCSTEDKICFNCKRVELMNCECPCECSLNALTTGYVVNEYMYGDLLDENKNMQDKQINIFESVEICPTPIEEFRPNKIGLVGSANSINNLNTCVNFTCEKYSNQLDCLGIVGCEWCQVDIDETLLPSPFCTHQSACYFGILGSSTPYGDASDIGADMDDSILPPAYAAIGPITFAIVILLLIIGFVMYCYRNNSEPGSEQLYIESLPVEHNFGLPLSRLDCESPHSGSDIIDKANNPNNLSSDISPYRMHAGNFRRPPNGESSDHGYSTMTPHEDSEHYTDACFTLIEPLISNKCSKTSISDYTSHNTDQDAANSSNSINYGKYASSKSEKFATTPDSSSYTSHHIQAPVTVHHPMEAIL